MMRHEILRVKIIHRHSSHLHGYLILSLEPAPRLYTSQLRYHPKIMHTPLPPAPALAVLSMVKKRSRTLEIVGSIAAWSQSIVPRRDGSPCLSPLGSALRCHAAESGATTSTSAASKIFSSIEIHPSTTILCTSNSLNTQLRPPSPPAHPRP